MNRSALEKSTASLVVILTTIVSLGLILIIANAIFQWDIFPPFSEKILYFLASAMVVIIVAATLVNIMLNISRLAYFSEKIAQKLLDDTKKHG